MKNSLIDLNNHLFAQIERLSDEEIKGDQLKAEIERTQAITSLAKEIVSNASTILKAQELATSQALRCGSQKSLRILSISEKEE